MSREKKTVWELERFALEIRRQTIRELHSLGSSQRGLAGSTCSRSP